MIVSLNLLVKVTCVLLLFFCENDAAWIKYPVDVVEEEFVVVVVPILLRGVLLFQQLKFVVSSFGLDLAIRLFEIFLRNHTVERILFQSLFKNRVQLMLFANFLRLKGKCLNIALNFQFIVTQKITLFSPQPLFQQQFATDTSSLNPLCLLQFTDSFSEEICIDCGDSPLALEDGG